MSVTQNRSLVRDLVEEVFSQGNLSWIEAHVAPDFIEHEAPAFIAPEALGDLPSGRERLYQWMAMLRQAFPDLRGTIHDIIAEGDRVAFRWTVQGTQTGEFMGIPASGNRISVEIYDILRFSGGKAVEHWGLTDTMALMQQLGALSAPDHR